MALNNILAPRQQVLTSQGVPLAGGSVFLYEPGTTTFITSYREAGLVNAHTNPVRLSGSGRANIWISRDCDLRIEDRNGNLVLTEDNANPDALGGGDIGGLVPNGSFELDADADLIPDGWSLVNEAASNNAIDSTESTDGNNSFRFTSTGFGGGSLTVTDFFPVNDVDDLRVNFDMRSTLATVRNIVRVEWYDISTVFISNTDVYDSTANPLVYTTFNLLATPPANARFAKLRLIGIDPSVLLAGSTFFDRVEVFYPTVVSGIFDNITIQNNEIITTNVNGALNLRPNGNGAVVIDLNGSPIFATQDNAVNILAPGTGDPTVPDGISAALKWQSSDGNDYGQIDFGSGDPGDMIIRNLARGGVLGGNVEAAAGGELPAWAATEFSMDLYEPSDFEVRLSTALSSAPGALAGIAIQGSTAIDPSTGGNQDQILEFRNSGIQVSAMMGFSTSPDLLLQNLVHGGELQLLGQTLAGAGTLLFAGDPDGESAMYGFNNRRIAASADGTMNLIADDNSDTSTIQMRFTRLDNQTAAILGFTALSNDTMIIQNQRTNGEMHFLMNDGGLLRTYIEMDPQLDQIRGFFNANERWRINDIGVSDVQFSMQMADPGGTLRVVGMGVMPVVEEDNSVTINTPANMGTYVHRDAGAPTFDVDQETTVQVGATWMIVNDAADTMLLDPGTGVTIRWMDGPGGAVVSRTAGSPFTLAIGAVITIVKYTDIEYHIFGGGIS